MVLIRASPVVRPRICWTITLAEAVFRFCRRLVSASAFGKLIDAFEESTKAFCRAPPGALFGCGLLAFFPGRDDDFEAAVFTRFERAVRLENVVERVSFRNKAARVDGSLLDERKRFFESRCIHPARFEDEILAVHAGRRQRLIVLVHSGNHHHGVGPRDAP